MSEPHHIMDGVQARWDQLARCVTIADGYLTLHGPCDYDIELDRIDTPERILAWVTHLSAKTWVEPWMLRRLIQVAMRHIGKVPGQIPA
jgi:hypothetical protein